jgi:hypothetical protein
MAAMIVTREQWLNDTRSRFGIATYRKHVRTLRTVMRWWQVTVTVPNTVFADDPGLMNALEWCSGNCTGRFTAIGFSTFAFELDRDAILFLLTFGE